LQRRGALIAGRGDRSPTADCPAGEVGSGDVRGIHRCCAGGTTDSYAAHHLLGAAFALIVLIVLVALRWRANGWLVMANLPFSLLGSVLVMAVTGIGMSLGSLVGLVTVFGISAR